MVGSVVQNLLFGPRSGVCGRGKVRLIKETMHVAGEALETGDMWKRISESNEAATRGLGPSATAGQAPQKRAPQKKGPSLYRILSDFVNLENFDPNKPPDVESMVSGMLELTGAKEDVDGFYTAKADKAVKAWKVR